MANADDVKRARQGREVWNAWAQAEINRGRKTRVDFSDIDTDLAFGGFLFPGHADFGHTRFAHRPDFSEAEFFGEAWFIGAEFRHGALFTRAKFHAEARFERTVFSGSAWFYEVEFSHHAWFMDARFADHNNFGATFSGNAVFARATFDGDAPFSGALFEGRRVEFDDTAFARVPDFRNVRFGIAPVPQGTTVAYAAHGSRRLWARLMARAQGREDAACYRRLKQLAAEAKDHEQELAFFVQEMRAKRFHEIKTFWPIALNVAYDWLSEYGRSVARPATWLGGMTTLAFLAIAVATSSGTTAQVALSKLGATLVLALTNAALLLGSDKWLLRVKAFQTLTGGDNEKSFGLLGETLAYGQSAFSLLLFFLIGLGLRNRFRIGGGGN